MWILWEHGRGAVSGGVLGGERGGGGVKEVGEEEQEGKKGEVYPWMYSGLAPK